MAVHPLFTPIDYTLEKIIFFDRHSNDKLSMEFAGKSRDAMDIK